MFPIGRNARDKNKDMLFFIFVYILGEGGMPGAYRYPAAK